MLTRVWFDTFFASLMRRHESQDTFTVHVKSRGDTRHKFGCIALTAACCVLLLLLLLLLLLIPQFRYPPVFWAHKQQPEVNKNNQQPQQQKYHTAQQEQKHLKKTKKPADSSQTSTDNLQATIYIRFN